MGRSEDSTVLVSLACGSLSGIASSTVTTADNGRGESWEKYKHKLNLSCTLLLSLKKVDLKATPLQKAKVVRVYKTPKSHPFFPQVSISSLFSAARRRRSSNFRSISNSPTRSFFIHPE
ncbi:hypothetical protein L1987_58823 [Smallanthus sonchifolius]|uniref:Uncharacterized protein n=1 Tax=Smallanthus sonchifolius TaxID=185202 RepID=A0ACB9D3V2_9ASTR|nr:hypothetical protein L1987_58823 [Smallanthus sonchifolius]